MSKTIFTAGSILLAAAVLFSACNNNVETPKALVTVTVNDFTITQEDLPSAQHAPQRVAQNPASYTGVGAIDLVMFASDGSEAYRHTQLKSDGSTFTTFGEFSFTIPVGNYTMVVVARQVGTGDVFTVTSPTEAGYTSERPRETFCKTQTVTVTNASPLELSVTLKRIVSALNIISTDGRPVSATKVRTTFSKGGKSFNPTTGLALTDNGFTQTNNPSSAVGAAINITGFQFLTSADDAEEEIDVTIDVLDADDNVLFTHTVEDVPFKRNRKTILSGAIFSASASAASFQLDTDWITEETVNF